MHVLQLKAPDRLLRVWKYNERLILRTARIKQRGKEVLKFPEHNSPMLNIFPICLLWRWQGHMVSHSGTYPHQNVYSINFTFLKWNSESWYTTLLVRRVLRWLSIRDEQFFFGSVHEEFHRSCSKFMKSMGDKYCCSFLVKLKANKQAVCKGLLTKVMV